MNLNSVFVADNHSQSGKQSEHNELSSSQPKPNLHQRSRENTQILKVANECPICHISFAHPTSFQMHMEQWHQKPMPHLCALCGKCYASAQGLQFHLQAHSGKIYVCPVCNSNFSQSSTMRRHMRLIHKSNQCAKCKGVFRMNQDYYQHVRNCHPQYFHG